MNRAAFDAHMMPPASVSSAAAAAAAAANDAMDDMEMELVDASSSQTANPSAAGRGGAAAAAAASSFIAAAPQPAAPAAAAANCDPNPSSSALRPPFLQPCRNSEACPLRCEDPAHPGHQTSYLRSNREAHQSVCSQRPVRCTLCAPQHVLPCAALEEHIAALMAHPGKRAFAITQISSLCATGEWEAQKKARQG